MPPDAPLKDWAEATAARVAEHKPVAVYVCPVPGAEETADAMAKLGNVQVKPFPGFEKAGSTAWKGLSPQDLAIMDCTLDEAPAEVDIILPFGLDIGELREIVGKGLDGIAEAHKKETVAVISHRALTIVMILHLLHFQNKHYRQIAQEEGAVNLFEVRAGMPSALYINDTCHLHGLI